eukprot:Unigene6063_Nuclearia_a/m.18591 Unigene6063_Nuclearia_a/g.18591  ORF Unigene6063_Nuclearia_a/g.18591 Unigene6063_Nuclearia_a/m.18591 type:complete len:307 (-) Unigene6063_Nuclearia_a:2381-3301(-)
MSSLGRVVTVSPSGENSMPTAFEACISSNAGYIALGRAISSIRDNAGTSGWCCRANVVAVAGEGAGAGAAAAAVAVTVVAALASKALPVSLPLPSTAALFVRTASGVVSSSSGSSFSAALVCMISWKTTASSCRSCRDTSSNSSRCARVHDRVDSSHGVASASALRSAMLAGFATNAPMDGPCSSSVSSALTAQHRSRVCRLNGASWVFRTSSSASTCSGFSSNAAGRAGTSGNGCSCSLDQSRTGQRGERPVGPDASSGRVWAAVSSSLSSTRSCTSTGGDMSRASSTMTLPSGHVWLTLLPSDS